MKKDPPGWIPQWSVTFGILGVIFLAGFGVAKFYDLWTATAGDLVWLIPITLSPYLAYKGWKYQSNGKSMETNKE